jgi:hypothetical protein
MLGGQARYSNLAIGTALILRAVFHQPPLKVRGAKYQKLYRRMS